MKAKWLNEQTWVCLNHLSTVRLPANTDSCWYAGCRSQRPEKRPEPPMRLISKLPDTSFELEKAYAEIAAVKATIKKPVEPPEPVVEVPKPPKPIESVGAPKPVEPIEAQEPAKRRSGVTVNCAVCNAELYRKPSEVSGNKLGVFFCSRAHQDEYAKSGVNSTPNVSCAVCNTPLKRKQSEIAGNKLGVFFCCREHQNQWHSNRKP